MAKIERNRPCPCGSGRKYKHCCGDPTRQRARPPEVLAVTTLPAAQLTVPGLPGEQVTLIVEPQFPDPADPRNTRGPSGLPGDYRVTFVLARPGFALVPERDSKPVSELEGDSHVAVSKPAFDIPGNPDADQIKIHSKTEDGEFEFTGFANSRGFLGKIASKPFVSDSHADARQKASRALSPLLSNWSVHLDIPLNILQWETEELRTSVISRSFLTPHTEVLFAVDSTVQLSAEFRGYAGLYREALNSNSPVYRFLCLYKIIDGILDRRRRLGAEATRLGTGFKRPEERIPSEPPEFIPWLNAIFPVQKKWDEATLSDIFLPETIGRKIKHLVDEDLHRLRTNVAHALAAGSGDLTLSPDESLHIGMVCKWLPITRCIVRRMLKNEFPNEFLSYLLEHSTIPTEQPATELGTEPQQP
jgi:hypothetical protein